MNEKNYVVITTINKPTEAIKNFAQWKNWNVVIVGDRKSPPDWECEGVTYLHLEDQYSNSSLGLLAKEIPENTYTRKILGYLYAIKHGATAIFESDDDNIPYSGSQKYVDDYLINPERKNIEKYSSSNGWLNIYSVFGASNCWPRGFPMQKIAKIDIQPTINNESHYSHLIQFLADEDPDVDAIYRMVNGCPSYFAKEKEIALEIGTFSPINSQATLWTPELYPLLFLPIGIFDRVTDILRGYIATAALHCMHKTVTYASPIVYQKRNVHNLLKDFEEEIPLYLNAEAWCEQFKKIEARNFIEFYHKAIIMLEKQNIFSINNSEAYELFIKTANLK